MKKLLSLIIVLGFIFACTSVFMFFATVMVSEVANIDSEGTVLWGQNKTLREDETINDDVVMFGGNLTMPKGSEIDGDLAVFGGNADIDGSITGEVAVTGGNVNLGETAYVGGDIGVFGGQLSRATGATVGGEVHMMGGDQDNSGYANRRQGRESQANQDRGDESTFTAPDAPKAPETPREPKAPKTPDMSARSHENDWGNKDWGDDWGDKYDRSPGSGFFGGLFGFIWNIIQTITLIITLIVISWLVAALLPEQMKVVGDTALENSMMSFGVGLATLIITTVVGGVLAITICLAPISLLAWAVASVAFLFGWIALAQIVGERLLVALDRPFPNFTTSTMFGTIVLVLLFKMPIIGSIPCLGWLLHFVGFMVVSVIGLTGLGAVILSRFGTQADGKNMDYGSFNFGSWSNRPRTSWPDPDLDIKDKPKGDEPKVDLNKE